MSATRLVATGALLGAALYFWRIESGDKRAIPAEKPAEAEAKTSTPQPEPDFEKKIPTAGHKYQWLIDIAMTEGVQQAFRQLESQIPNEDTKRTRNSLAVAILHADFKKLAEVLNAMPSATERNDVIVSTTHSAIRSDKKSALEVIRGQLAGSDQNKALQCATMELLMERMFSDAVNVLAEIPPSDDRHHALMNVAYNLARASIVDALQWSEGLSESERDAAFEHIKMALVDRRDVQGLKTFLERATDRMARFSTIKCIISFGLERGDDAGVSAFIETLHDEEKAVGEQHEAMRLAQRGRN